MKAQSEKVARYGDEGLAEFQRHNCFNCYFAEAGQVGTGLPCCTYPKGIVVEADVCQSKREGEPRA